MAMRPISSMPPSSIGAYPATDVGRTATTAGFGARRHTEKAGAKRGAVTAAFALTAFCDGVGGVAAERGSLGRLRADAIAATSDAPHARARVGPGRASCISRAEADAVRRELAARRAARAAVGRVDVEIDALAVAARFALDADAAAGPAMIGIGQDVLHALAIAAAARPMAFWDPVGALSADPGTAVSARTAVVAVARQISAPAATAALPLGAGGAAAAMPRVGVEVEALAAALLAAGLAFALLAFAGGAVAAILVLVALLADLLATGGRIAMVSNQQQAETRAEEGLAGGAAGGGQRPRQGVKAVGVHGCPDLVTVTGR